MAGDRYKPHESVLGIRSDESRHRTPIAPPEGSVVEILQEDSDGNRPVVGPHRLFSAIVNSSDDAIISQGLDGIITSWNGSAERLFGYTAEEAIGQPITILIPPDRLEEEPKIIARLKRGERVEHFETVRRRKDGGLIDLSLTPIPHISSPTPTSFQHSTARPSNVPSASRWTISITSHAPSSRPRRGWFSPRQMASPSMLPPAAMRPDSFRWPTITRS